MTSSLGALSIPVASRPHITGCLHKNTSSSWHALDAKYIKHAAELADKSACCTVPHPNFGCVITNGNGAAVGEGRVVGEGYLYAEGTTPAELQAVESARELCRGSTAYLNMEPGDCYGDYTAISALVNAGISRVVVGIRNPLQHLRGNAIRALKSEGLQVDVLGEDIQSKTIELVNAPFLYRAAYRVPFSLLKYAMTLDGKLLQPVGIHHG